MGISLQWWEMDQFQWHSKFLSADITEGGKKPIRCLMYFIKYIWIWSKQSKEHSCQGIMTNVCTTNQMLVGFLFTFFRHSSVMILELSMMSGKGVKKRQLNKMIHFFYFALQHCKWHRWQCLVTYQYVSSERFLPATSKKYIFLHKDKGAFPLISDLQGQLQAFVSVSWDLTVFKIIPRHPICFRLPTSPCLFQNTTA